MRRKQGYGQFCPVAKASEVVAERWTPLVLRELMHGSRRFGELRRGLPLMSPSLLSQRLKELEAAGVLERERAGKRGYEYRLTEAGEALRPVIEGLGAWGLRWTRSAVGKDDLDPSLLMWDVRRSIDCSALPARRCVIEFDFVDVPGARGRYWLVTEAGEVDLCLQHPGHEVDLHIETDIRTMVDVWLGHVPVGQAVRHEDVRLSGATHLARRFPRWIGLSSLVRG